MVKLTAFVGVIDLVGLYLSRRVPVTEVCIASSEVPIRWLNTYSWECVWLHTYSWECSTTFAVQSTVGGVRRWHGVSVHMIVPCCELINSRGN